MRISEIFNLNKSQHELDFVDIDIGRDTPLFLDPYLIGNREDEWSRNAHRTIESFFQYILELYKSDLKTEAKMLFENLGESNETCLGISENMPNGRGVGVGEAETIFDNLIDSHVIESGVVKRFEDMVIFVKNVGKDKISDLATNIIRKHLIEYTISQCELHKIPLQRDVPTGNYWDGSRKNWINEYNRGLVVEGRVIILVPKWCVSYTSAYTSDQYCRHFVLNFLKNEHLRLNTSLVKSRVLKNGATKRWVVKDEVAKHEGAYRKEYLVDFTAKHPEIFQDFKRKYKKKMRPLTNEELDVILEQEQIDIIDYLINKFDEIDVGNKQANDFHKLITGVMEYIFYPQLTRPTVEDEIHDGRKRIDISFDNSAKEGFFHELHQTKGIQSPYIFVECKNYGKEIKNPELDQIAGRFSPNRGRFGIIVFRSTENMDYIIKKCADAYHDSRGCILPLEDKDFKEMLNQIREENNGYIEEFLKKRLRKIIIQ
ncbi:hypothetical protein FQ087_02935 [Sporosarcina sp. ANT_H38]|uniref:hypothetical protein n=1 Tax=Sporosarcina sp. ANT_H38 TaxID=2597358 RepID=UPI0011F0F45C|nr:hypothetical protein [Sporosarcina sp. ANT_H38]KAA0965280.1 hypothetical protein FQ087_02935 [Sporosarcina sp. ANT_H38]